MITRVIKEENVRRLHRLLVDARKIAIICHKGPDGDAVGSSLALAHVLGSLGKDARAIIPDTTSALLMKLPEAKELVDAVRHADFARNLMLEQTLSSASISTIPNGWTVWPIRCLPPRLRK